MKFSIRHVAQGEIISKPLPHHSFISFETKESGVLISREYSDAIFLTQSQLKSISDLKEDETIELDLF